MSRRSEGLFGNFLGSKWSLTAAPTAGTTVVASVSAPQSASSTHILESLSFCVKNMAAAAHTVTLAVRDTSVAGTVRWSMDFVVAAAASKEIALSNMGIEAVQGGPLHFTTDTVLASVKATVNAAGWTDISSN